MVGYINDMKKLVRKMRASKLPRIPVPDKDEQLPVTAGVRLQ